MTGEKFRKIFMAIAAVGVLASVGGVAIKRAYASDDCCAAGAPCCKPGAACCAAHKQPH
jgi:hypothetical protein